MGRLTSSSDVLAGFWGRSASPGRPIGTGRSALTIRRRHQCVYGLELAVLLQQQLVMHQPLGLGLQGAEGAQRAAVRAPVLPVAAHRPGQGVAGRIEIEGLGRFAPNLGVALLVQQHLHRLRAVAFGENIALAVAPVAPADALAALVGGGTLQAAVGAVAVDAAVQTGLAEIGLVAGAEQEGGGLGTIAVLVEILGHQQAVLGLADDVAPVAAGTGRGGRLALGVEIEHRGRGPGGEMDAVVEMGRRQQRQRRGGGVGGPVRRPEPFLGIEALRRGGGGQGQQG